MIAAWFPPAALAAGPGQVDPSFDGDGVATLDAGTQILGVALQSDGKVVVAGFSGTEAKPTPYAARLNRDGTRDASFQPQLPSGVALTDVKLRSGDRLIFSGTARQENGTPDGMVALSLLSSGARDTNFSADGLQTALPGVEKSAEARGVAVAPDGKVVLGGIAYNETALPTATVLRLTADGEPDGKLGSGVSVAAGPSQFNGVSVQSDGGIIGVGQRQQGLPIVALVARVTSSGDVDAGFRGGGSFLKQYAGEGGGFSALNDVAIDGAGRILATGTSRKAASPSGQSLTVRFTPSGESGGFGSDDNRTIDASQSSNFSPPNPGGYGVVLDGDRTYVGGTFDAGIPQLSAVLLNGAGNLDPSFGTGGQTVFGLGLSTAIRGTGGVALGPDGLYVAGVAGSAGAVARVGTVARVDAVPAPVPVPPVEGTPLTNDPAKPIVPNPTPKPAPKPVAPTLSATSLKPSKITSRRAATLRYRLSKAGVLSISVEQSTRGRRSTSGKSKGDCEKASSRNAKGKACTFYAKVGSDKTIKVPKAGARTTKLTRKVTNRTLKVGTYRLVLRASDATRKAQGSVRRITFRVAAR